MNNNRICLFGSLLGRTECTYMRVLGLYKNDTN